MMRDHFTVVSARGFCIEREYIGVEDPVLWGTHYYGLTPQPWHFTAIIRRPA